MLRLVVLAAVALLLAVRPAPAVEPVETVHVASNGWHTGIVVRRAALPPGVLPEAAALPPSPYLEFGWGDREYFPAPDPGVLDALGAGLFPGPAVMHIVAVPAPPRVAYPGAEVVTFTVDAAAFRSLVAALDADVERPAAGAVAEAVAPGLHPGRSLFFPATGRFHAFNTCNTWTAEVLAEAGVDVDPKGVQTAEEVMAQLRALPGVRHRPATAE